MKYENSQTGKSGYDDAIKSSQNAKSGDNGQDNSQKSVISNMGNARSVTDGNLSIYAKFRRAVGDSLDVAMCWLD